jgi:hypothetical protein
MLGFDSLTSVAKGNIIDNISLHTAPPISGLEIMVHLIPFMMNGISGLVSLTKYLILHLLDGLIKISDQSTSQLHLVGEAPDVVTISRGHHHSFSSFSGVAREVVVLQLLHLFLQFMS